MSEPPVRFCTDLVIDIEWPYLGGRNPPDRKWIARQTLHGEEKILGVVSQDTRRDTVRIRGLPLILV